MSDVSRDSCARLMTEGREELAPEGRALGGLPSEAEHRRLVGLLDGALFQSKTPIRATG